MRGKNVMVDLKISGPAIIYLGNQAGLVLGSDNDLTKPGYTIPQFRALKNQRIGGVV